MTIKLRTKKNKKFDTLYADIYYGYKKREYVKLGKLFPLKNNPHMKHHNKVVYEQF